MALIGCPECAREISDQAVSCPHCGYPMRRELGPLHPAAGREFRHEVRMADPARQRWKALRLAGLAVTGVGLVSLVLGAPTAVIVVFLLAGPIVYAVARIGAWWQRD